MAVKKSHTDRVLELARKVGVIRPKDLKALGIPEVYLWRLHHRGLLEQVGRGLYATKNANVTENHSLAEAAKRVPHAALCLLSALRFHQMTTQLPHEVWLAIGPKTKRPKPNGLTLRIVRFSGNALTSGIEEHTVEGVTVRIYNPAKTVADGFKYRNKIGLDVALEALRDCMRQRKATADELWRYAKVCRMANVMRPYLEALS
jgi:predicted transcriptional regulator of viral defense system